MDCAVYLDPRAMDATAGAIDEHAREVEQTVAALETTCCAEVPPQLAAWLAQELHDITVVTRLAGVLYAVAAEDTAVRAEQIRADQSLAAAWPELATSVPVTTMGDLGTALAGSSVAGGTSATFDVSIAMPASMTAAGGGSLSFPVSIGDPGSMTNGEDSSSTFPATSTIPGSQTAGDGSASTITVTVPTDGSSGPFFPGMSASDMALVTDVLRTPIDNVLAPRGITVDAGRLVDSAGNTGGPGDLYPDPFVPGSWRIR